MAKHELPDVVGDVYKLLAPLSPEDRKRVVDSVFALLGESAPGSAQQGADSDGGTGARIGPRLQRWLQQNQITEEQILEAFHFDGNAWEYVAADLPGSSARAKARNCYLVAGVLGYLRSDDPRFQDQEAVSLCRRFDCYDKNNHSAMRKAIGLGGSKETEFSLPVPRLREAAEVIKELIRA